MQIRSYAVTLALALIVSTAAVYADSRIEYKATEGTGSSLSTILIGQGKIRTDGDPTTSVIIDPTAGASIILDHSKKTFTRIGRAELAQMADMMKAMANMPPEVRQMMQGRLGGAGGEQPVTVDTGEKAVVAGKSCRVFRTTLQGKTTAEYCMAEASAIEIPAADRATLVAAMAWSKELVDTLAKGPMGRFADSTPFRAGLVPLRSTTISSSGARMTSEFVGVTSAALPADLFVVPAGYKEVKIDSGRTER